MGKEARLVAMYFKAIGQDNPSDNWTATITTTVKKLMSNGASEELIENSIKEDAYKFDRIVTNRLKGNTSPTKKVTSSAQGNLLKPNQFYYHPFLQMAPPPPVITLNEDGTFSESYSNEGFYLKMKECIQYEDILKYFNGKFIDVIGEQTISKKSEGAIKYVFENTMIPTAEQWKDASLNPLDLLLFTIDAADNITAHDATKSRKISSGILGITEFVDDGLEIYKEKINYCKLSDVCHVY